MPDVAGAVAILEGEPTTRRAVEAWLLAGEPIEAIARRCGVPVEAVEVYEQLFFNVADRLTSTSYILFHAIGAASYRGFDGDDTGAVLKWFAYMGGPRVLDFLLGGGDTPCDLLPTEGHAIPPDEAARSARLRRMALAAKALPINPSTAMRLIGLYALQEELLGTSRRSSPRRPLRQPRLHARGPDPVARRRGPGRRRDRWGRPARSERGDARLGDHRRPGRHRPPEVRRGRGRYSRRRGS